ncbi:MAG: hypothetical protein RMJ43_07120 [Chloroherpetonaceae bacterium]|nr:hypothetical protein [Chloroherpetonaceae bacterium]
MSAEELSVGGEGAGVVGDGEVSFEGFPVAKAEFAGDFQGIFDFEGAEGVGLEAHAEGGVG